MHFLGRAGGWPLPFQLWRLRDRGVLQISELTQAHERRMQELMERYKNVPIDLADSSLVAISESLKLMRIFTLDSDFRIYRTADGGTFDIAP
jgi:predicted nucleic acid-binding protein